MLVGRQGTGSREVHLARAVPALWAFSCLCHFPQSKLVCSGSPDTASLGMKLSKGGCSLAGGSCCEVAEPWAAPALWGRCAAANAASAARVPPRLPGPPSALPPCLARFPSRGKQDTSGGGGERSVPPAHPDTEATNTNMPICAGSALAPTLDVHAPLLSPGRGVGDRAPKFGTCVLAWGQQYQHPLSSSLPTPQF